MKRTFLCIPALVLALSSSTAIAGGRLSDDDAGRISAEIDTAKQDYLDKEFNGRSYEELNSSERRQFLKQTDAIEKDVLKQNNVSRGSYETSMMRARKGSAIEASRAQHNERIQNERKEAAAKEAEAKAKAEGEKSESTPGVSSENGVTVERRDQASGAVQTTEGGVSVSRGNGSAPMRMGSGRRF